MGKILINERQLEILTEHVLFEQEIDSTMDNEWVDEETKEQYEETMKHLCRLTKRGGIKNGRLLK